MTFDEWFPTSGFVDEIKEPMRIAWMSSKLQPPCPLPPPGWWCTRHKGHPGPCAAHEQ